MFQPISVKVLDHYRLWIRYSDGIEGEVDLSHLVGKGIFSRWEDYQEFGKVHIGEGGAISWDEDIDLCPDAVYLQITGRSPEDVFPNLKTEQTGA